MELTNRFKVHVPLEQAWAILTDVERIAPCLPGAELQEVDGEEYRGVVKVKVGPITAQYKGTARFLELDAAAHKAVLRADGRETRGQGNASATVTATLAAEGDATSVSVVTELTVAGKVAQFGRGVLGDVSNKLMTQFAESLEATVLAEQDTDNPSSAPSSTVSEDGARATVASDAAEAPKRATPPPADSSVDLLKVVLPSVLKRIIPALLAAGALIVPLVVRRIRRSSKA